VSDDGLPDDLAGLLVGAHGEDPWLAQFIVAERRAVPASIGRSVSAPAPAQPVISAPIPEPAAVSTPEAHEAESLPGEERAEGAPLEDVLLWYVGLGATSARELCRLLRRRWSTVGAALRGLETQGRVVRTARTGRGCLWRLR
jgi:hypothetical protein